MTPTRSSTIRLIRTIGIICIILIIISYISWRSFDYIRGPEIVIFEPTQYISLATSTVTIRGQAKRINNLLFNNSPLSIDEEGNFIHTSIVFPGINIFTFTADDKFGREITSELRITGTIDLPTPPKTSSSTDTI